MGMEGVCRSNEQYHVAKINETGNEVLNMAKCRAFVKCQCSKKLIHRQPRA